MSFAPAGPPMYTAEFAERAILRCVVCVCVLCACLCVCVCVCV